MLRRLEEERGQVIVLFVFVFSIFLVVAAFAIDQGFWYGRRRVVQKDADLAARSGAFAYLNDRFDTSGAGGQAVRTAQDNGATGIVTGAGDPDCPGVVDGAPSVSIQIEGEARRFFSGLPLISDDSGPIQVDASSTACVGGISTLYVANGRNTLKAIPIALRSNAPGTDTCFTAETLDLGEECVIYGSKATPFRPGFDRDDEHELWARRRMIFNVPASPGQCEGGGSVVGSFDEFERGLEFTCTPTTGDSCSGNDKCINTEHINEDGNQERVLDAMGDRLDNSTNCDSLEGSEPAQSFQNAFGNADGDPGLAPDPPDLGGSGSTSHVYVQNDCYNNPRVVMLPIVSTGQNNNSPPEPVRGFATIYITGCYNVLDDPDPDSVPALEKESNECDGSWNVRMCDVLPFFVPPEDCFVEIRGIPIHQFITEGSLGGITEYTTSSPLTIQTVK